MKFEIPGKLPGLNEIIDAAKSHYGEYARMKETYTSMVAWLAKRLPKHEKVALIITWYEPNRRRDPDNIAGGTKFICDGLAAAETIPDDSQKHVKGIVHQFRVDKVNPRIEVEIVDLKENPESFEGQELWD